MGVVLGMINTNFLTITPELLNLIAEIDEFKGSWKALGTLPLSPSFRPRGRKASEQYRHQSLQHSR